MEIIQDINNSFLSEIMIAFFIIINLLFSIIFSKKFFRVSKWLCIIQLMISLVALSFTQVEPIYLGFNSGIYSNVYTMFFKILIFVSSIFMVFLSRNFINEISSRSFEYFTLILFSILSSLIIISANDFLILFTAIEMLSLSLYILITFKRGVNSKEAALKYIIISALATGITLFGISYLYGITGSLNFSQINNYLVTTSNTEIPLLFNFSCIFILSGLMMKIGAIPFANWVADIYEGASFSIAAFISIIPKVAIFAILIRLSVLIFKFSPMINLIIAIISILTIIYGSLGAIRQTNIKRFMGYSSVTHSGFILLGLLAPISVYGISTIIYYLVIYIFMNTGAWAALILFNGKKKMFKISDYKGLIYQRPFYTFAFSICLISLAGLPPTGGFLAKFYLFSSIIRTSVGNFFVLIIVMILASLSIYFYTNLIKNLFDRTIPIKNLYNKATSPKVLLYLCATLLIVFFLYSDKIIQICQIVSYEI